MAQKGGAPQAGSGSGSQQGFQGRKPPEPPKFITKQGADGKTELLKVSVLKTQVEPARLQPANNAITQAVSRFAKEHGSVDYSGAAHRFPPQKVDSRYEAKRSAADSGTRDSSDGFRMGEGSSGFDQDSVAGSKSSMSSSSRYDQRGSNIPAHVGTTYYHMPNAHRVAPMPPPLAPSVPRPFVSTHNPDLFDGPMMHNRTADGKIIGITTPVYIDSKYVPKPSVDVPVGPDNPIKELNHIWSACWDGEASAVYYYNQETGEATWIQPVTEF